MSIRDVFAANLRKLRLERGLSQEELGHQANMHRTYVSSLERCEYSVSIDALADLATALGVKPSELLRFDDPVEPEAAKDHNHV
ncbi:helix-turn-helix domain-containing protein [Shinella sp.]|uniref:helix-turn-helix domain-containing protein n=1 Tax=Shinella sp. TaxID=1870904 RepID=UPI003D266D89